MKMFKITGFRLYFRTILSQPFGLRFKDIVLLFVLIASSGCAGESIEYRETKRIDEKVTEAEIQTFLAVVKSLPNQQLPELPTVFAPPPEWNQTRTLPVNELINEERVMLEERWSVESLARHLDRNRVLQRVLRREQITPEQFVGLTLALGAALSRTSLRENQDLDEILEKGQLVLDSLSGESESFSSLSGERRHYFLQKASWVTRVDRAKRLTIVPPENIALVEKYRESLEKVFPAEFTNNPLDAVADLLGERGMPFDELVESGVDDQIEWNLDEAIIGRDAPDPEFAAAATTKLEPEFPDDPELNGVNETKVNETKVNETKVNETKVNETKANETKANETKANETKATTDPNKN